MTFAVDGGVDPQHPGAQNTRGHKTTPSHHILPSPSPSHSAPDNRDELFSPSPSKLRGKSHSPPACLVSETVGGRCGPRGQKRKRTVSEQDSSDCDRKRQVSRTKTTSSFVSQVDETGSSGGPAETPDDPIRYWADTQQWPENFASMSRDQSKSPRKRLPSSSYSQSVKAGEAPKAHSAAYERRLAEHGVYMDELQGHPLLQEKSKELFRELLKGTYPNPPYTMFPLPEFLSVWRRVRNRNEARVFRDITPLLVPSPELLYINGHQELEHVLEDINTEWSKCKTLGGPQPKPDLAIGISPSAFDEGELAKLRNHTAFERTTMVTDNLYFPFLMCEVKCGDEAINKADRQNMHSCSIAVDAIIQLYRSWDVQKAAELSGQILVFSISHDSSFAKLYGHFAVINGEKLSFYRYPVSFFVINFDENEGRKRTHDFVREIYKTFYPAHLKRIRDALAAMEDPRNMSPVSVVGPGDEVPAEFDPSVQSSQEASSSFKVPGTPASKKQKNELALLQAQMAEQQKQIDQLLQANQLLQKK